MKSLPTVLIYHTKATPIKSFFFKLSYLNCYLLIQHRHRTFDAATTYTDHIPFKSEIQIEIDSVAQLWLPPPMHLVNYSCWCYGVLTITNWQTKLIDWMAAFLAAPRALTPGRLLNPMHATKQLEGRECLLSYYMYVQIRSQTLITLIVSV